MGMSAAPLQLSMIFASGRSCGLTKRENASLNSDTCSSVSESAWRSDVSYKFLSIRDPPPQSVEVAGWLNSQCAAYHSERVEMTDVKYEVFSSSG